MTTGVENPSRTPRRNAKTALLWALQLALAAVFAGAGGAAVAVVMAGATINNQAILDENPALPLAPLLLTSGVAWVHRAQLP